MNPAQWLEEGQKVPTRSFTFGLILAAALSATALAQNIRYVDDDAPSGGDGQTWATSYNDLQDALAEARSNSAITEIRVAGGTYSPGPDREDSFAMVNNVAIRGGYRGLVLGGNSDDRDISLFETILTGVTDITDPWPDYVYNVFKHEEELILDETAILDGMTITGGQAYGYFDYRGGGMYNDTNCNPTIIDCVFTGNSAKNGGAIYNYLSNPVIVNCLFIDNAAQEGGCILSTASDLTITGCSFIANSAGVCGAVYIDQGELVVSGSSFLRNHQDYGGALRIINCSATATNCVFRDNIAYEDCGGLELASEGGAIEDCLFANNVARYGSGGAIRNTGDNTTINRCVFRSNSAGNYGGGICNYRGNDFKASECVFEANTSLTSGGAISNESSDANIANCRFIRNGATGTGGGAIWNYHCDAEVTNCSFIGNVSDRIGGSIYNYESNPTLTNCTILGSTAHYGASIYNSVNCNTVIANCVLWGNTSESGSQIVDYSSTTSASYSCIQDGWPGVGNINEDPLLFLSGDPHLTPGSPCVDSGTDSTPVILPAYDLDSNGRLLDGDGNTIAQVDMGAYEFNPDAPAIGTDTENLVFLALEGGDNPADQTLSVYNCGVDSLDWEITGKPDWLTVTPTSGQSSGESDEVTFTVDASGLSRGAYTATLEVVALQAANSPKRVDLTLYIGQRTYVFDPSGIQPYIIRSQPGDVLEVGPGTSWEPTINLLGRAITIRSTDGPEKTILDGDNLYTVLKCVSGETPNTVIDGFTILDGDGESGAGILNKFSSPTIRNCVFRGNNASHSGGAIDNDINSNPKIANCLFTGNSSVYSGGAVCNSRNSSPLLVNCTFTGN